jgi:hypothetical protein
MKKFVFAMRLALMTIMMSVSGYAFADCEKTNTCQNVDPVVVICQGICGGGTGGGGGNFEGIGGGGCYPNCNGGGGGDNGVSLKIPIFGDLIKLGNVFCKKDDEVCGHGGWLSRMLGLCATYGPGAQGGCNAAVGVESQANDCRNTKPC